MKLIAIDGACKNNGKPNCISVGAAVALNHLDDGSFMPYKVTVKVEQDGSTSQRGELNALIEALEMSTTIADDDIYVITDSEYIYNTVTKEWYKRWQQNGWETRDGNAVKNQDLWCVIAALILRIEKQFNSKELTFFHIKGHCMPFGTMTSRKILARYSDRAKAATDLLAEVHLKLQGLLEANKPPKRYLEADETFRRINNHTVPMQSLTTFMCTNILVDLIASDALADYVFNQEVNEGLEIADLY